MGTELEQLRRRLYLPEASGDDVEAYRRGLVVEQASASAETEAAVLRPSGPARPRRLLVAVVALALIGVAAAVAALVPPHVGASAGPVLRPPIVRTSSAIGLTDDLAVQRQIDVAFSSPDRERAATAVLELDTRIRATALPWADGTTIRESTGGQDEDGPVVIAPPSGSVPVRRHDTVLFSTVTREPATATWRVLGWRRGEPHRPHPVVVIRSPRGGADRIAVAVLQVPEALTVTSVTVSVSERTPFRFHVEQHGLADCASSGSACTPIVPVASRNP